MKLIGLAATAAFCVCLLAPTGTALASSSDEMDVVRDATKTAEHMNRDPAFTEARKMLKDARAVLIVPALVKGGFVFGAEGGQGVLLARTHHGWSNPAFFTMAGGSFGLQIGLEKAEIVLLIMSDKALRAVQRAQFKFGAGAGLTVVTLSGGAEGATTPNLTGDIVVWTSATGAYGGLTLNGTVLKSSEDSDRDFYGHDVRVPDILSGRVRNPQANALRDEVASVY
jgi:lipid-binding SYLF domain-containing protein